MIVQVPLSVASECFRLSRPGNDCQSDSEPQLGGSATVLRPGPPGRATGYSPSHRDSSSLPVLSELAATVTPAFLRVRVSDTVMAGPGCRSQSESLSDWHGPVMVSLGVTVSRAWPRL